MVRLKLMIQVPEYVAATATARRAQRSTQFRDMALWQFGRSMMIDKVCIPAALLLAAARGWADYSVLFASDGEALENPFRNLFNANGFG